MSDKIRIKALPGLICLLSVWAVTGVSWGQSPPAELVSYPNLIFYNGQIITADDDETIVRAVAIRDGKFLAVGTDDRVLRLAGPDTQRIDLRGQTVVPGLIDNHGHGSWIGNVAKSGGSGRASFKTKESGLDEVRQLIEATPPGDWVTIRVPRNPSFFSVTRKDLDPISPNYPLMLITNGTDTTVNSQVVNLANIPEDMLGVVKDPQTGEVTGQYFGWPVGILIYEVRPWPNVPELIPLQKEEFLKRNAQGYTTNVGRGEGLSMTVIKELWAKGELTLRVRLALEFMRLNPNGKAFLKRLGNFSGFGDEWFRVIGTSVGPVDGGVGDGANLSAQPKIQLAEADAFGSFGQNKWLGHGFGHNSPHEFDDAPLAIKEQTEWQNIQLANRYGWNITSIHSTGDESTRITLLAYQTANQEKKLESRWGRWGIDHQPMQTPETLGLMKELNVTPSFQYFSQTHVRLYGADRVSKMVPLRTVIDQGILPMVEPSGVPFRRLEQFVTRKLDGRIFGADQKITRLEALYTFTKWGARRSNEEDMIGTIEPGKYADLVVLGGDFLRVPEDRICEDLPVMMTVVGGKIVFQTDQKRNNCEDRVVVGPE